jgi:hypothetical protein
MQEQIKISKKEYELLKKKAKLFEHYVETEELSKEELAKIQKALKSPSLSKSEFLKRHPELA